MSSDSDSAAAAGLTPAASTPGVKESEEKKEELVVVLEEEIGMNAGLKNLYSGKEDKRGRFQWQTKIPEDLGKPAEGMCYNDLHDTMLLDEAPVLLLVKKAWYLD